MGLILRLLILLFIAGTTGIFFEYLTLLQSPKYKKFNKARKNFELAKCAQFLPFALGLYLFEVPGMTLLGIVLCVLGWIFYGWVSRKSKKYLYEDSKDLESMAISLGITTIVQSILDFCRSNEALKKKRILTYDIEADWKIVKDDATQITWKRGQERTPLCLIDKTGTVNFDSQSWINVELPEDGGRHTQGKMIDLGFKIAIALGILESEDTEYVRSGMKDYLDGVIGYLDTD